MPTTPTSTRPTARQIAGGLGALGVLAIGLVGIPAVLAAAVGWPLPHHLPGIGQVAGAFNKPIPDSFWPHLLATLAWAAWTYFAFSVAAGLVAHVRRRPFARRRLGTQSALYALIAAVAVLGQLRLTPTARALPQPTPVALVADTAPASPVQTAPVTHAVAPGDTLWGIAATYYGDGERWQTIFDANVGVPQPGGGALTDSHWIYPGWHLTIPDLTAAVAPPTPEPTVGPATTPPAPPVVTTPATSPAIPRTPAPPSAAAPIAHPRTLHRADPRPAPAAHLHPTTTAVPRTRVPSVVQSRPVAATTPSAPHGNRPPVTATDAHRRPSAGSDLPAWSIGAGIFGLGAIGLIGALDRRRRRQLIRRPNGMRIALPAQPSALADLELQLRQYAGSDSLSMLARIGDLLAHAAEEAGIPRPTVAGVRVTPDGLDVLLAGDAGSPPTPFESDPTDLAVWHLPAGSEPDVPLVAEPIHLAFVTVGSKADGTLLANLAHFRTIHLAVGADRVPGTLAAIGTELAGAGGPDGPSVVVVGAGHGIVDRLDAGIVVPDLDAALGELHGQQPGVIVVDADLLSDGHGELAAGTIRHLVVTAGPVPPAGVGLVLDPACPDLDSHQFGQHEPAHVDQETLDHVEALLDLADAPPVAPADELPAQPTEPPRPVEREASDDNVPAGPIMLGLLGEPTITVGGEARDLIDAVAPIAETKARRVAELLVYLAAHDGTATRGQWLTDISPDKALSDGYVRNLVLLTRRTLESLTGISDLLTYDRATQRLILDTRVQSDWTAFRALAVDNEPHRLCEALSLVSGVPFGVNPEPWTSASGLSYTMMGAITDAAAALGERALSDGDTRLAAWAARQGQLADRYDQALWRILLRAAVDAPERQRIWRELHALIAVDGDPEADLDPATVDLYRALAAEQPRRGAVVVLQDDDDTVIPTRQAV